jgi:hypothetical protein
MEKEGVIITREQHPEIYEWLSENVYNYKKYQKHYTLTSDGKINAYCDVKLYYTVTQIKYPFGYVKGLFSCNGCTDLTSLIGAPKEVESSFSCNGCEKLTSLIGSPTEVGKSYIYSDCSQITSLIGFPKYIKLNIALGRNGFTNNSSYKKRDYRFYIAMWLELLESVTNKEREIYVKSYKDKVDWDNKQPIIPIEILKEYGF